MKKIKKQELKKQEQNKPEVILPLKILRENVLLVVLLFFGVITLYGNTLNGQFLTADDAPGIVNNPMVKNFSGSIATFELEKIYPATIFKLFGMNPVPFHVTSILLHFVTAVLVFIFVFILIGKTEALITTLVFVTHPINAEAVSWISAYGYLVYTILTLLILTFYVLWFKTKKQKYLTTSIVIYVMSLIFYRKPWVALIPVYLAIMDQFILEKKINFSKIKTYLWLAIPTLIYLVVYVRGLLAVRNELLATIYYNDPKTATPYFNRILYTIFMTMKLMLWPIALTIYHEGEKAHSLAEFTTIAAIATICLIGLLIFLFSKPKNVLFKQIGTLIILIYITMSLSFYPQVVVWAMAERYLYLGSVFFGLIIALIYSRNSKKEWVKYILITLLLFYSVRTMVRTEDWKNSKNLWIATQKVSPYSYRVYNNLGDVYATEGNYAEALKDFQISIQISPGFADAVHNLGYTYYQMGNLEQAKVYLVKSYEMNPLLYQALHKLGVIAFQQGDIPLARQYFTKTLQIAPDFEPASNALKFLNALPPDYVPQPINGTQQSTTTPTN